MINKSLHYWNKNPCNIRHSKKSDKFFFDKVKKKRFFVEKHIVSFANFKKYKNKNVLELGCGIGTDAIQFIKNNAVYYGVDFSKKSLDIANKAVKFYNLEKKKFKFYLLNIEKLNKIIKLKIKFDLIYSFGAIHHTKNMKNVFNEIYKLANKKTEIKIMLYAKNSYKNFLVKQKINNFRYEAAKGCPIVHKIDIEDLKKLTDKKFKILDIKQDFIFPYKIKLYKKNIYKKLSYFEKMPNNVFNCLSKNIGEHLLITLKKR